MRLSIFVRRDLIFASFLVLLPSLLFQLPLLAQQRGPMNVAVLDFDARAGLSKEEAMTLSDVVQANIVNMGDFVVVDRQRIRQILEEQGFQQTEACSQVECIVEAGKILKVEKMIVGTIGKIGSLFNISIQVVDIATAQIQTSKSRQHSGDIEEVVQEIVPNLCNEIAEEMLGRPPKRLAETSGGGSWFWYVVGTLIVGGGAAAAGFLLTQKADDGGVSGTTSTTDLPKPPVLP